jgi:hypothetical protein
MASTSPAPVSVPSFDEETPAKDVSESTLPQDADEKSLAQGQSEAIDLYVPLPEDGYAQPENSRVLTIRAVGVGCLLGSMVNASNLYLGKQASRTTVTDTLRAWKHIIAASMLILNH